jgi:integrase/recombinase XerD
MTELAAALADYLTLRRSLGYKLERAGEVLADFVAHLDRAGCEHVSIEGAVAWATLSANPESPWRAQRLGMVRNFARYLHAIDPAHQIPPPGLIPPGPGRPTPFLYSDEEVVALMAAARSVRSPLRAATLETVVGLLAVSGLRVGEAIRLDRDDVDIEQGALRIRYSKAGRSRVVPLHPSTIEALRAYGARRDELFPKPSAPSFFISTAGTRMRSGNLRQLFEEVLAAAGLPPRPARRGPRLGGLRHSFAVATVVDWHRAGAEVGPNLPLLSTYLGHISPASTYWYLSASPHLLAAAVHRLETNGPTP